MFFEVLPLLSPTSNHCKLKEKNNESQITDFLFQNAESGNLMEARTNVTKKKNPILIWDLISYKLKYRTKEARLILQSGIYNYFLLPISEGTALNKEKIYIPDCKISLASNLRKNLSMTTYSLMTPPLKFCVTASHEIKDSCLTEARLVFSVYFPNYLV